MFSDWEVLTHLQNPWQCVLGAVTAKPPKGRDSLPAALLVALLCTGSAWGSLSVQERGAGEDKVWELLGCGVCSPMAAGLRGLGSWCHSDSWNWNGRPGPCGSRIDRGADVFKWTWIQWRWK